MADFELDWKELEECVVDKIYDKILLRNWCGKRYGKDRFLISSDVKRIINYLNNTESALSWFVGRTSFETLAYCIEGWLENGFDDRKLLSQLGFKGMRYDYSPLIIRHSYNYEFVKEENKHLKELEKQYKEVDRIFDVKKIMFDIQDKINNCPVFEFERLVDELKILNDLILQSFVNEKNYAYKHNAVMVHYVRVIQYIQISEMLISDLFHRIIIVYQGMNQLDSLNSIFTIMEYLEKASEQYVFDNASVFDDIKIDDDGNTESAVTQAFGMYMQYNAYAEEVKQIEDLLVEDIKNNKERFYSPWLFKHLSLVNYGGNTKEALRDLKEENKINGNDYKKLGLTQAFIKRFYYDGTSKEDENKMVLLRVIYYEIFSNKARLADKNRNKTSNQLARLILDDCNIEDRQEIFLEKKIERGFFREARLLDEYEIYLKICQKYRKIMLLVSFLSDDIESYRMVHDVLMEMLKLIRDHAAIKDKNYSCD